MGFNSKIEWTRHTWNPFQGCRKISEGCKNCYMYADKRRYGQDPATVVRSKNATFRKPLVWHKEITRETPLADRLVFTASWSDWFIEENDAHRADAWEIIRQTPGLVYQILTKRADRIAECLPDDWGDGYPNVWLGVSVENQKAADERIPHLLETPAAIRFLSCEPLLEGIDLAKALPGRLNVHWTGHADENPRSEWGIDWVIVGGESGPNARPCHVEWIRSIVSQCRNAGVPAFVKQLGSNCYSDLSDDGNESYTRRVQVSGKGGNPSYWPYDLRVRELWKHV
ncbi:MAG: DUF5131 family protein [Acidobacteria bacterium]|nr:DUF5131 family protein [Acidobacteriota bacterium]